ncbi:MAG TPA: YdiU family protein [Sphingomicrobium sp.]|nr:YdiU family protein [Sphingomicrobium sp.]
MALAQSYRPDARIFELGEAFYDAVEPAAFPECRQRFVNRRAAATIGLDALSDEEWAAHFCRFEPLPRNIERPLALRYHGHQFRVYNPDIGDGRGFLFAQVRERSDRRAQPTQPARASGRLLDLGTKGSGVTPYSRTADGRLTLKGGVREILATEMLEALGVDTSKSFALFETGEKLTRGDEPSPTRSSVLTRLSHGHIRIGTFQRLAFFGDTQALNRLVRYCLEHFYGEAPATSDVENAQRLFALVSSATARLAASYMAAGFVHGVLNSDNINITGESFDYGPWRFTPYWDGDFTAAYFDHYGLYAFGSQPEAIQWDLAQFGGCLSLVSDAAPLSDALSAWGDQFEQALTGKLLWRLGVEPADEQSDAKVAAAIVEALAIRQVTIDRFFFDWRGGRDPDGRAYADNAFRELARLLEGRRNPRAQDHPYWSDEATCSMAIEEVEAIWDAIAQRDDWVRFEEKIAAIRRMGEAHQS